MSYDIIVSFEEWPDDAVAAWRAELARMGVEVEFYPDFEVDDGNGWVPLVMKVKDRTLIADADIMMECGEHLTGFGYYGESDQATFLCKRVEGNAAGLVCAAALCAITGGELEDSQLGETVSGKTGRDILRALSEISDFELTTPEEPAPFDSWNVVEDDDDDDDDGDGDADYDDDDD